MSHSSDEPFNSSRMSAQDAIYQAEQRAQKTAARNIVNLEGLPVNDTANLRQGPTLHDSLLTLLPLVGVWRGTGEGHDSQGDYRFGQQITITHDGRPFLYWESRSWRLNDDGQCMELSLRETGFWRCLNESQESHTIELVLAHAEGYVELLYGYSPSVTSWELVTDALARTSSTPVLGGAKRLYGLIEDGDLAYVEERLNEEGILTPRLSARLSRIVG